MKKGALVEFMSAFGTAVPNVIIFQYNPETLRHSWSQPLPQTGQAGQLTSSPFAVSGLPSETFSFSLSMDVIDQFADDDAAVRLEAKSYGIYTRLAALEMLLYPVDPGGPNTGGGRSTPAAQVPPVLFVWGTGRILPVRVTSLTITEKLYDADLNPTHAEAQLELRVLTPHRARCRHHRARPDRRRRIQILARPAQGSRRLQTRCVGPSRHRHAQRQGTPKGMRRHVLRQ
ncbi:MAG: hypothetical protein IPK78_20005 [Rhodospirillales bacterium]|nr:hypothetical protein [Rhodospirillales bacterium]